jgi:putative redox protein
VSERVDVDLEVDGITLSAFLTAPGLPAPTDRPALLVIHGLPSPQRPGEPSRSYELLADRVSDALGWTVLAVSLRGCGRSGGDFHLEGWLADVATAVTYLHDEVGIPDVWLVGSTTGGSVALLAAARDPSVVGVAAIAPRSDFDDWAAASEEFRRYCLDVGIIRDPEYPPDLAEWADELVRNRPIDAAAALGDRPVLLLHGDGDRQVPVDDSLALAADLAGAELHVITAGDHRLRHDPRAVALLLGWLDQHGGGMN